MQTMPAIKLLPCPFCEGPPCPIVVRGLGGGVFPDSELEGPDGLDIDAHVYCHECGAQGETFHGIAYDREDCRDLERKAVEAWQARDARHRNLYDAGESDQHNLYPRP